MGSKPSKDGRFLFHTTPNIYNMHYTCRARYKVTLLYFATFKKTVMGANTPWPVAQMSDLILYQFSLSKSPKS